MDDKGEKTAKEYVCEVCSKTIDAINIVKSMCYWGTHYICRDCYRKYMYSIGYKK